MRIDTLLCSMVYERFKYRSLILGRGEGNGDGHNRESQRKKGKKDIFFYRVQRNTDINKVYII